MQSIRRYYLDDQEVTLALKAVYSGGNGVERETFPGAFSCRNGTPHLFKREHLLHVTTTPFSKKLGESSYDFGAAAWNTADRVGSPRRLSIVVHRRYSGSLSNGCRIESAAIISDNEP